MASYEIKRKLGEGAFGVVYHVEDIDTGKQFAMKTFRDESMWEADFLKLKNLQHKNIVRLFELTEFDGETVLLMEYCFGGDLRKFLNKRNTSLTENKIWKWLSQLTDGLLYIHDEEEMVHRDLKPENILIKGNTLKIADFGIARIMNRYATSMSIQGYGTQCYMAPELWSGRFSYDSDIWALGCIVYEMCTLDILYGRVHGDLSKASTVAAHVPYSEELRKRLPAMLRENPKDRPTISQIWYKLRKYELRRDYYQQIGYPF